MQKMWWAEGSLFVRMVRSSWTVVGKQQQRKMSGMGLPQVDTTGCRQKSLFTSPRRTGQSSGMKFLPSAVWQQGMKTVECEKMKNEEFHTQAPRSI